MVARRAGNVVKVAVQDFFKSLKEGERFRFDELAGIVGEELGVDFLESEEEYYRLLEAVVEVLVDAGLSSWAGLAIEALVVDGIGDSLVVSELRGGRKVVDAAWEGTPEGRILQEYVLRNFWASDRLRWEVVDASGPTFAFRFLDAGLVKSREELEWLLEYRLEGAAVGVSGFFPNYVDRVVREAKIKWGLLTREEVEADVGLKYPWLKGGR